MNNLTYLGIVERGRFRPLATESDTSGLLRLTTLAINATEPPESGEVRLTDHEGAAILVRGVDRGEWIYSATIDESAGLILTAVVQQVFDLAAGQRQQRFRYPIGPPAG